MDTVIRCSSLCGTVQTIPCSLRPYLIYVDDELVNSAMNIRLSLSTDLNLTDKKEEFVKIEENVSYVTPLLMHYISFLHLFLI